MVDEEIIVHYLIQVSNIFPRTHLVQNQGLGEPGNLTQLAALISI